MLENLMGFYETENGFNDITTDYISLAKAKANRKNLLVKAHEKEIYSLNLNNNVIIAKIHRDNKGVYPFSKLDFLSHKIQELVYPNLVPKIYAADFTEKSTPMYIVEKIPLEKYHIAYNIWRQQDNRQKGLDYKYNPDFLKINSNEDIETLAKRHIQMVDVMKDEYGDLLLEKGIAFDYSYVNITWRNNLPVALEVHKCQRDYLFNYDKCMEYFKEKYPNTEQKENGIKILERMNAIKR